MEIISEIFNLSQKTENKLLNIYQEKADDSRRELLDALKKLDKIIKEES